MFIFFFYRKVKDLEKVLDIEMNLVLFIFIKWINCILNFVNLFLVWWSCIGYVVGVGNLI